MLRTITDVTEIVIGFHLEHQPNNVTSTTFENVRRD